MAFRLVPRYNEREEDSASYCNHAGHLLQLKKCHWTGLDDFQSQTYFPLFAYSHIYNLFPFDEQKASLLTITCITDRFPHSLFPS